MQRKKRRALKTQSVNNPKTAETASATNPASRSRWRLWLLTFCFTALATVAVICRHQIAVYFADEAANIKYIHRRGTAERLLSIAQFLSTDIPEVALTKARWERRDGNLQASLEYLEQAIERGAATGQLDLEQALFAAQQNPTPTTDKRLIKLLENHSDQRDDICLAYSLGYLSHRRYDSGRLLLKGWSDEDSNNSLPLALLGTMFSEQKYAKEAESYFRSALQLDPDHPIASFGLAELLAENGRLEESLLYYERATNHKTHSQVDAVVGWSDALQSLGKLDQARQVLDQFLKQHPRSSSIQSQRASLALEEGDFDLVVELLQPEIDRGSQQQTVNYAYATAQQRRGNSDIAERHFQIAAEASKEGLALLQLDAQLIREPDNIELKYEIGWRNLRYGNPNEGLFWLSQVLKVDPSHAKAHQALGEYYSGLSQPTEATRKLAELHIRMANSSPSPTEK